MKKLPYMILMGIIIGLFAWQGLSLILEKPTVDSEWGSFPSVWEAAQNPSATENHQKELIGLLLTALKVDENLGKSERKMLQEFLTSSLLRFVSDYDKLTLFNAGNETKTSEKTANLTHRLAKILQLPSSGSLEDVLLHSYAPINEESWAKERDKIPKIVEKAMTHYPSIYKDFLISGVPVYYWFILQVMLLTGILIFIFISSKNGSKSSAVIR